jgi:hypothetical protein
MGVLEAGPGKQEVVKPVIERHAGDGDAKVGHVGEARQRHAPGAWTWRKMTSCSSP